MMEIDWWVYDGRAVMPHAWDGVKWWCIPAALPTNIIQHVSPSTFPAQTAAVWPWWLPVNLGGPAASRPHQSPADLKQRTQL